LNYIYENVPEADKARADDINGKITKYESEKQIATGTDLAKDAAEAAEA
jgi:hypothetical protein